MNLRVSQTCAFRFLHVVHIDMRMAANQLLLVSNLSRLNIDLELIEIVTVARAQKSLDHRQSCWIWQWLSITAMLCI